jgi:hypothetical protein
LPLTSGYISPSLKSTLYHPKITIPQNIEIAIVILRMTFLWVLSFYRRSFDLVKVRVDEKGIRH